jgi:hypothetical protein
VITYYDRAGNEISQSAAFLEPPLLFETMLFTGDPNHEFENWADRYTTEEQAKAGHAAIVEGLRAGRWPS